MNGPFAWGCPGQRPDHVRPARGSDWVELSSFWGRKGRSCLSVIPITSDLDTSFFGDDANEDQVGWLDGAISRFGRSYTGEPGRIAEKLARDKAVGAADTLLLTVPSQLGVEYNAALLETIAREVAPAVGWRPAMARSRA